MRAPDGMISAWIGIAVDIEEQKQMELALRRSEREASEAATLLTSIEEAAPVGLKLVDRDFKIVRINRMLADICGLDVEKILGRTIAEVMPELWSEVESSYRRALHGETIRNVDVTTQDLIEPHRTRHWLANYFPVWVGGEIIGVGNVVFDITERKEEDEFRDVVMDNVAEGIYAMDGEGLVTYVNPAACRMLGWAEDELLGRPMHETVHFQRADGTPHPAEECPMLQELTHGRTVQILDDAYTRRGRLHLPGGLLVGAPAERADGPRRRRRVPRHDRGEEGAGRRTARAGDPQLGGPDPRSHRRGAPRPVRPADRAARAGRRRARSSCSGWLAATARSSCPAPSFRWRSASG